MSKSPTEQRNTLSNGKNKNLPEAASSLKAPKSPEASGDAGVWRAWLTAKDPTLETLPVPVTTASQADRRSLASAWLQVQDGLHLRLLSEGEVPAVGLLGQAQQTPRARHLGPLCFRGRGNLFHFA